MDSFVDRQKAKVRKLIVYSVVVHALIFFGVMNIYFTSPVERGMSSHKSEAKAVANRVVVFLSDGLRAEGIFHPDHDHRTPYLTHIRVSRGSWGVSHTQVPTESRPGHVAIFAGMYEDPSAVMEGWQHNPIDFDHVFNQSGNSWLWGSPDIVHMFNRGKSKKIRSYSYRADFEKFSGNQDTRLLDDWVFNKVKRFMNLKTIAPCRDVCENENIFFLHLLGLDTVGHVYKPNSKEYVSNIELVDRRIEEIELIFEKFFRDDATTYLFTSDHGMTDWGSHGSGTLFETQSPFIAWGAGILTNDVQNDILQADIAPLISTLIGINIPVNSVGVLPDGYLNITDEQRAHALFANALQLGEQFNIKRTKMEKNTLHVFFKPFIKLTGDDYNHLVDVIKYNLKSKKFANAIHDSRELILLIQEGLLYFKNYYTIPLLMCLAVGLFLWIIYLGISIVNFHDDDRRFHERKQKHLVDSDIIFQFITIVGSIIALIWLFLFYQSVELKYYFYFSFPFGVTILIALEADQLVYTKQVLGRWGYDKLISISVLYLMGIEILVMAFFHRAFISAALIGLVGWVLWERKGADTFSRLLWTILCFSAALFPLLPPLSFTFSYKFSVFALLLWWYVVIIITTNQINSYLVESQPYKLLFIIGNVWQCFVMGAALIVLVWVSVSFKMQTEVPDFVYTSAWICLFVCLVMMHISPRYLITRSFTITNSLLTVYLLMSFSYEGIFLIVFIALLSQWCYIEFEGSRRNYFEHLYMTFHVNVHIDRSSNMTDFRRSFFFITFILLSYFGSGNIADINSFDPMWVRCFVSIFSPFTMTFLILVKITIPFLLTTVCFRVINTLTSARMMNMFAIVLLFCDIMVINFMFLVKNEGSWLDIGLSISRFCISIAMTIALLLFYVIAYFITCSPYYDWFYNKFVIYMCS